MNLEKSLSNEEKFEFVPQICLFRQPCTKAETINFNIDNTSEVIIRNNDSVNKNLNLFKRKAYKIWQPNLTPIHETSSLPLKQKDCSLLRAASPHRINTKTSVKNNYFAIQSTPRGQRSMSSTLDYIKFNSETIQYDKTDDTMDWMPQYGKRVKVDKSSNNDSAYESDTDLNTSMLYVETLMKRKRKHCSSMLDQKRSLKAKNEVLNVINPSQLTTNYTARNSANVQGTLEFTETAVVNYEDDMSRVRAKMKRISLVSQEDIGNNNNCVGYENAYF